MQKFNYHTHTYRCGHADLDYTDEALGQHFIFDDNINLRIFGSVDFTNEELIRYAKYIEKAMELKIPNIIAHPDIYMMKRKQFEDIEEKVAHMICKSAEKYNIPLEINLNDIFYKTYFENRKLNNVPIEKQKEKLINCLKVNAITL